MQKDKQYWENVVGGVNALMQILKRKPRAFKSGYYCSPGGILNAYREGDINFDKAVKELETWKNRKLQESLSARAKPAVVSESQREMRLRIGI